MHALPPDDALRAQLHNEVHARPPPLIRLPALVFYVAVLNEGVSRAEEHAHLCRLPSDRAHDLALSELDDNFLRLRCPGYSLKWERHSEYSRYSLVQPLPAGAALGQAAPDWRAELACGAQWLSQIPGRTITALQLVLMAHPEPITALDAARAWFATRPVVAARIGQGAAVVMTDFRLAADGFELMLVLTPPSTSATRCGRIVQRLVELETYRLMALRALPVTKELAPMLAHAEAQLASVTAQLDAKQADEQTLLDSLVSIAASVERAMAQHAYRFSATEAYDALVRQRLTELREQPIAGLQTPGEFMQRRLSPAIATAAATSRRLNALSVRTSRASALLRTRVDIASEAQTQLLLEKLTLGQALQLKLQATVEGLSIAAISYYVVSLLLYGAKALKSTGLAVNPEAVAGASVPVVLWVVWRATQRIHAKLVGTH